MNRSLILIGILAIVVGFLGCSGSTPQANDELVKLRADLIRSREAADSASQKTALLQAKLDEYEKEMKGLRDTYDEDHKTMEDLYKLQADTKANLLSLKDDMTSKIANLEAQLGSAKDSTLREQLDSLQSKLSDQFQTLQAGTTANQGKIIALGKQLDSLQTALSDAGPSAAIDSIMNKYVDFEMSANDKIAQFGEDINTLQKHIQAQDSSTYDILSQLVLLENKILSLTNSFNEIMNMSPAQAATSPSTGGYQSDYTAPATSARPSMTEAEYKRLYIDALSNYQNGNYNDAIRSFSTLIATDRNNDLADNAEYWIAESYYAQDNYQRALVEFRKVFDFPNSNKSDAAQFKIGYCYLNMGNASQARIEFQKFLTDYPTSDYIQKARQILAKL